MQQAFYFESVTRETDTSASERLLVLPRFPSTRYQGSKRKLVHDLYNRLAGLTFNSALDLFSGTATVSLLLRHMGKHVHANDYQKFNQCVARVMLTSANSGLSGIDYKSELPRLLEEASSAHERLVSQKFRGIFFTDEENAQIDGFAQRVSELDHQRRDLYTYAVGQALLMKRPYNLFHRANLTMRLRDVKRSFGNAATWETPICVHAIGILDELARFPFNGNGSRHIVTGVNSQQFERLPQAVDLVYLDPPYINSRGVGVDYADFYGFLEGICDYTLFDSGSTDYPHRPIARKPTSWSNRAMALSELRAICHWWRNSIICVSYRSDGTPTPIEIENVIGETHVCSVESSGRYKYVLSSGSGGQELLFVGHPKAAPEVPAH